MDEKMISRCCKSELLTDSYYYYCLKCLRPCDMLKFNDDTRNYSNEYRKFNACRSESEIEESFD